MSWGDAGIGLSQKKQKDRQQSGYVSPLSRMGVVVNTAQNEAESIGDAYNKGGFGAAVGRGTRAFGAVTGQAAKQFALNQMQGVMPLMQGTAQAYKTMTTGDPTPIWNTTAQQEDQSPSPAPTSEPVALTETANRAVQQPTAGGQPAAQPAEPQPETGYKTEARQVGGVEANVTLNPNNRVTKVVSGDPNSPGYGMVELVDPNAKARGVPSPEQVAAYQNQQAAMRRYGNIMRPNGESDRDFNANSQVVVTPGRGRATNNPGYTFAGSAGDAARFFQSVPHGGGYNPYKQSFRTLFDEQMDARRAAKAAPQPVEQGPMGWQRLRDKMNNESRERIAEMTGGFGLTQAGMQDARAREQLAQQYGFNMAQLGNDNLRTQAALGLSGLQQQAQQLQLAQAARLNAAQEKMMNARPGSKEWLENRSIVQALSGNNGQGNQTHVLGNDVEGKYLAETYTGEDGRTYQRRIPEEGGQPDSTIFEGDQLDQALKADPDFAKKHKKAKTEAERKALEREWILNRRANL